MFHLAFYQLDVTVSPCTVISGEQNWQCRVLSKMPLRRSRLIFTQPTERGAQAQIPDRLAVEPVSLPIGQDRVDLNRYACQLASLRVMLFVDEPVNPYVKGPFDQKGLSFGLGSLFMITSTSWAQNPTILARFFRRLRLRSQISHVRKLCRVSADGRG